MPDEAGRDQPEEPFLPTPWAILVSPLGDWCMAGHSVAIGKRAPLTTGERRKLWEGFDS